MRSPEEQERQLREDALLATLAYGTLAEQRRSLASTSEAQLTRAVLVRVLGMRPAVRDLLLDRDNPGTETLARIAGVLARQYAAGRPDAPPSDLVLRFSDRYPAFAELVRDALLAVLPEAAANGAGALRRTIEAALLSPALDEADLLGLVEAAAEPEETLLCLAATHPSAGERLWHRLLDVSDEPRVAGAIAAMPTARSVPGLRARLEAGPPDAQVELALDAPRDVFSRIFFRLADERPDLALVLLERVSPPRSEWIAAEALASLLEADDATLRQATIAALGRLRLPHPYSTG